MKTAELLTITDAAEYMRCSTRTVWRHIDDIPHYTGPLGVRFKKADLEQWVLATRVKTVKELIKGGVTL